MDESAVESLSESERERLYRTASSIERYLYETLEELGVPFQPQLGFGIYRVDAYLPTLLLALESDGCRVHHCPSCGYADGTWLEEAAKKRALTYTRDTYLAKHYGVTTLRIWQHDMRTRGAARAAVRAVLAPYLDLP